MQAVTTQNHATNLWHDSEWPLLVTSDNFDLCHLLNSGDFEDIFKSGIKQPLNLHMTHE